MVNMRVKIGPLELKNPVMPASGCFSFGKEIAELYDLSLLGAIVVKATTLETRLGNPTPRVAETPAGMLNAIGLQNPGVDKVLADELPHLRNYDLPVIVNVAGTATDDYVEVTRRLAESDLVDALELNISCPNVKCGGIQFGVDPILAADLVAAVKQASGTKPLIVKLSPNVTDIVHMAKAVVDAGADALSLINTLVGMNIDLHRRKPLIAIGTGGLSGPAVKPVAVRMVYHVAQAVSVPIIGMGGIMTGEDAIEFMMAGASAVAVGTANFVNPYACPEIVEQMKDWCLAHGVTEIASLRGAAHEHLVSPSICDPEDAVPTQIK